MSSWRFLLVVIVVSLTVALGVGASQYFTCRNGGNIYMSQRCDGKKDCYYNDDETDCLAYEQNDAKAKLTKWFIGLRNNGTTTNRWGHNLPRIIALLYLVDPNFFSTGNRTGEEMAYELSLQMLSQMMGDGQLEKNELALYVHALMVTCTDPRTFYGHDLVAELRTRVEQVNYTINPFDFLVLCNAGTSMSKKDMERVLASYDTPRRSFWTDHQAMSTMALACISSQAKIRVDERELMDLSRELKKHQFRNGSVENLKTTALVMQALIAIDSLRDFNFDEAIKTFIDVQTADGSIGSFLDSYYVLPVLSNTSLLNISNEHCMKTSPSEEEALSEFQRSRGKRHSAKYSVWVGKDTSLQKTWTLKVPMNCTYYDIIEQAQRLDNRQKAIYNVVDGKPFVTSLTGLDDDMEKGVYWYTYVRNQNSDDEPRLVEESPVDVQLQTNQELILWYREG